MKYIWVFILIAVIVGVIMWAKKVSIQPPQEIPETTSSLEEQAPKEEVTPISNKRVQNGMTIETTKEGNGPAITNGQIAVVQYEGKLTDGSIFDSTAKHGGQPFSFPLGAGRVIKGWDQGVLGMKVGETRLLTIPPELGYGAEGYPPIIPQNATLIFTVTLEAIK